MSADSVVFDPEIIRRFDINGPRYTSYPTADRFAPLSAERARHHLGARDALIGGRPLSLYFHVTVLSSRLCGSLRTDVNN